MTLYFIGPRQITASAALSSSRPTETTDRFSLIWTGAMPPVASGPQPLPVQAENLRDARAVQVHVQQADLLAGLGQRYRQVGRDGALAHAALAGQHEDLSADPLHAGRQAQAPPARAGIHPCGGYLRSSGS